MNSKSFAYRVFVFLVVMGAMWSTGACSDNSTPVSDTQQNNAAFIQAQVTPTSGPRTVTTNARPSPTPTEIPLILPTPTEVGAGTPLPTNLLLPPPTITPTATPTRTPLPTPTPTNTPLPPPSPTPAPAVNIAGIIMLDFQGYQDLQRNILFPLTNQCIRNTFLTAPAATKAGLPADSLIQNARATESAWFDNILSIYIRPPLGSIERSSSVVITDVNSTQTRIIESRPDLVLMWHVLNNLTIQLVDPDTDPATYQRAYEESLNIMIDRFMKETRARVVVGNVPDITSLWYYKPCFSPEVLRRVQQSYNTIISNAARRYPSRVFVADLTGIELGKYAQYVALDDGFSLTVAGHREVSKVFANVILRLGITQPIKEPSLYYPGSPAPGSGGGSGATTPPVRGTTTPPGGGTTAPPGSGTTTAPGSTPAPSTTP